MSARYQKWLPVVDDAICTGCGRCLEACGPRSLQIVRSAAVLARPGNCGSDEFCMAACTEGAIRMEWVDLAGDKDRGKWRAEVDVLEIIRSHEKRQH